MNTNVSCDTAPVKKTKPRKGRVLRLVVQIHFHDEKNPRYYFTGRGSQYHAHGTSNLDACDLYDLDDRAAAERAFKEADSSWSRQAKVEIVQADVTKRYLRELAQSENRVNTLRSALGYPPVDVMGKF